MPKYPKGSDEMKMYMKNLREMRGKNPKPKKIKGSGIMSDLFGSLKNVAINEGQKFVKEKGAELLNKGLNMAVEKVAEKVKGKGMKKSKSMKGKGFLGDIGKSVFKSALNVIPMPGIVRDVAGNVGEMLINKTGAGMNNNMEDSIMVGKDKTVMKKRGGALRIGGALRTLKV